MTNATVETEIEKSVNHVTDAILAAVATAIEETTGAVETGKMIRGTEIGTIAEREITETHGAEKDRRITEIRNEIDIGNQDYRTTRRKSEYYVHCFSWIVFNTNVLSNELSKI